MKTAIVMTAILMCLLAFTSIATITVSLTAPKLDLQELFQRSLLDSEPLPPTPTGDPVGGSGGPH